MNLIIDSNCLKHFASMMDSSFDATRPCSSWRTMQVFQRREDWTTSRDMSWRLVDLTDLDRRWVELSSEKIRHLQKIRHELMWVDYRGFANLYLDVPYWFDWQSSETAAVFLVPVWLYALCHMTSVDSCDLCWRRCAAERSILSQKPCMGRRKASHY